MKKIGTLLLAISCLMTVAPLASYAQTPPLQSPQVDQSVTRTQGERPGAVITREGEIQATVAAINTETREITLQGANGKTVTLKAGPNIARFNEIKQGDRVTVKVTESLAITVAAPGAMSTPDVSQDNQKTPDGRTVSAAGRTSAVVSAIDYKARTVTLQTPNGKSQSFQVGPEVKRFNAIKKGDVVLVSYVEAVAAEITRN